MHVSLVRQVVNKTEGILLKRWWAALASVVLVDVNVQLKVSPWNLVLLHIDFGVLQPPEEQLR